jgi:tetratricopeptide (TPR) repeat protein
MFMAGMKEQAQEPFDQVLQAAREIGWVREQAEVVRAIAEAMAQAGLWEQALRIAEEIKEARKRAETVELIATGMAVARIAEETLWKQALQIAKGIGWALEQVFALEAIAEAMARVGIMQQTLWNQALQMAESIQEARLSAEALSSIIKAMAGSELTKGAIWKQALQTLERIGEEKWILMQTAEAVARAGEVERSISIVEQAIGLRGNILPSVLQALTERAQAGDERSRRGFLRLLPLCGWSSRLAYSACTLLARLYPEQMEGIALAVSGRPPAA